MNHQRSMFIFLGIVLIVALPSCTKRTASRKSVNTAHALPQKSQAATKKNNARNIRALLKKCRSFAAYAQEEYAQEITLVKQMNNEHKESATFAKNIKEIAIKRHEEHLQTWSNTFDQLFQRDYTRNTPLHYYQLEIERDLNHVHWLSRKLKKISHALVEADDKELAEQIAQLDHTLTEVYNCIRFDLDFVRDKQACTMDINTRYHNN